jgi:hypothetical protein
VKQTSSSAAVFGSSSDRAFDQEPFSHWVANFTPEAIARGPIFVEAQYPSQFTLVYYQVLSANTLPGEDPRTWVIEGGNEPVAPATEPDMWTVIDSQTDIFWDNRHEIKNFIIKCKKLPFTRYRMRVTATRDATISPNVQVAELMFYYYGDRPVTEPICDISSSMQLLPRYVTLLLPLLLLAFRMA